MQAGQARSLPQLTRLPPPSDAKRPMLTADDITTKLNDAS